MAKRARTVAARKKPYAAPALVRYGALGRLTQAGSMTGAEMSGNAMRPSSRHVKQDLVRVGEHRLGFGVYLYRYKPRWRARWGAQRQLGVVAEEVEAILPAAVSRGADGIKRVDYARL